MTAEEYWNALVAKNPALDKRDDETITLKVRGLRAMIKQAHAKGEEAGATPKARNPFGDPGGMGNSSWPFPWLNK